MMAESISAQPVGEGSDPFTGVAGGESVRSRVRWKALVAKRRQSRMFAKKALSHPRPSQRKSMYFRIDVFYYFSSCICVGLFTHLCQTLLVFFFSLFRKALIYVAQALNSEI